MASPQVTVYAVDEYDSLSFDAVLVRERTVVCLDGAETVRVVPLDKVNHIDADADLMLIEREIPETFYGGGEYGFVNVEQYPEIEQHIEELAREEY